MIGLKIRVDRLRTENIEDIVALSSYIGWDYNREEIETIFKSGIVYGVWNERKKLIASAAIILYGEALASIGMVIVHPDYKGRGIGKIITDACVKSVSAHTPIMLIATGEGKPLYEKLGFRAVSYVSKYICNSYNVNDYCIGNEDYIMNYNECDLEEIIKLDEYAFGTNREEFLTKRIMQSEQCIVVKDKEQNALGYGLSVQTPENKIIGPVVAKNDEMAMRIVHHLARDHNDKLRIDVPEGKNDFMNQLESVGFQKVNTPPIMMKNSDKLLKRSNELYSIAAQIFG
ncbi:MULTISPECIES: GNAT family N-acetyltransferase [Bacillus]|uniref:GNAT family N-acetyltransferase n=1 Tax=Bacillus thuringiensis serovar sooncheon TaxID=180891 RepID=A0A9Q5SHN2_BACTU|nr:MULTISPECIES: GNAT family N-acetyltransferase [Bacillus]PEU83858.1 GNAT family N-acetyltransferase [Bacillus anthracis]MDC7974205.1 GNAT family N-acetyltransferase [Bacillus sp. BLCC-B18]OTW68206.1 GNAT family N-acetyltransferase [Bacillus thuringiensis serovar coreanensis]OTX44823.1 GNAT family N-acetyltransferase [Bacillus thuringiensis serovar sooncheon]OTX53987.1 GNAT family N-acetyltransferase [Bacillus thuringiensis serovar guiyangiensis]